jgi:hypothetical protein
MLYSSTIAEIGTFRQHQWQITGLSLVADAGVVAAFNGVGMTDRAAFFVLTFVTVMVGVAAYSACAALAHAIELRIGRLARVRSLLSAEFRHAWGNGDGVGWRLTQEWLFPAAILGGMAATLAVLGALDKFFKWLFG